MKKTNKKQYSEYRENYISIKIFYIVNDGNKKAIRKETVVDFNVFRLFRILLKFKLFRLINRFNGRLNLHCAYLNSVVYCDQPVRIFSEIPIDIMWRRWYFTKCSTKMSSKITSSQNTNIPDKLCKIPMFQINYSPLSSVYYGKHIKNCKSNIGHLEIGLCRFSNNIRCQDNFFTIPCEWKPKCFEILKCFS